MIIGNVEALDFKAWYQKPVAIGLGIVALFAFLIFIFKKKENLLDIIQKNFVQAAFYRPIRFWKTL